MSSLSWNDFYERAEKVDNKMTLSKAELRIQYREYCRRLDSLGWTRMKDYVVGASVDRLTKTLRRRVFLS